MAIPDSWGMSWNDPNGQGGGSDRHISAYCNMTDTSAIIKKNQRMHINARKIAQDRRHPRQQMLTRANPLRYIQQTNESVSGIVC